MNMNIDLSAELVYTELFGECYHVIDRFHDDYGDCRKCGQLITEKEIDELLDTQDLLRLRIWTFNKKINKVMGFISSNSEDGLKVKSFGKEGLVEISFMIKGTQTTIHSGTKNFGAALFFLGYVLYEYLVSTGIPKEEVRRMINGTN